MSAYRRAVLTVAVILAVALTVNSSSSHAALVKWALDGVSFDTTIDAFFADHRPGGTVTANGFFVYDAQSGQVQDWHIEFASPNNLPLGALVPPVLLRSS